jgi:hypothetical protein
MQSVDRSTKMTLRLTDAEAEVRDKIAVRIGSNASGVMRQALLMFGESLGIVLAPKTKAPDPKGPSARKR